jgi:hypothetical protein
MFYDETHLIVSYSYFCRCVDRLTAQKTVRTGAADMDLRNLPEVVMERAFYGISWHNTWVIDEKPFVLRKSAPHSYYIAKDAPLGPLYRPLYKMLKGGPVYLIAVVCVRGLVCYHLSDSPFNSRSFSAFCKRMVEYVPRDGKRRWLLMDNASFHNLDEFTWQDFVEAKVGVTHTPPSGCFMSPIEEWFGMVSARFTKMYHAAVISEHKYVLTRSKVVELVHAAVMACGCHDLSKLYARAGFR